MLLPLYHVLGLQHATILGAHRGDFVSCRRCGAARSAPEPVPGELDTGLLAVSGHLSGVTVNATVSWNV